MASAKQKKQIAGLILTLTVSFLVSVLYFSGILERLEFISYDQRMAFHRKDALLHDDIAVVLIDEASLQAMDPLVGRYPWPRSVYGDLIDFLALGGARAVVFDILFTESEKSTLGQHTSQSDERLTQASAESGIAIHAVQILKESLADTEAGYLSKPMPSVFINRHAIQGAKGFTDSGNNNFLLPLDGLYEATRGIGAVGIEPDADGIYRRAKLFSVYQGHVFPSLSVAPLLQQFSAQPPQHFTDHIRFGDRHIPLDKQGNLLVNMTGDYRPYSISGLFSSIQKLQAGELENMLVYPDEFENKIVFIGASAIGLEDIKTTPVSAKTPGVMIHASIVSNILNGRFLDDAGHITTVVTITLLAAITMAGILSFSNIYLQAVIPLVLTLLYAGWSLWRFQYHEVYHLTAPLLSIILAWLTAITYMVFTEAKDKRRVRTMFSQYVSPAVLNQLTEHYEDQLGAGIGKKENLSILFSDIRGFTGISEQLEAEQVVDLLNTHFSVMSEVIFRHHGTMDKFIGDAIMAFWGAPIRLDDHAERSVRAAIEMMRSLELVNEQLANKGYPSIRVGIGINTGSVVLGNIGSERKLDYTVIGDNVNLASRLEGLTNQYGCPIIISEYTYQDLAGGIPCALIDQVRVKGKQVPIRLFWPLALPTDDPQALEDAGQLAKLTVDGFEAYFERNWDKALEYYQHLPDGQLKTIFLNRCESYKTNPPPEHWDGVFTLTSK